MADLVIGYGNTLRGDDGLGRRVAETVALEAWPGVRAIGVHQLTPELVEEITGADRVVFVDAAADARPLSLLPLTALEACALGHSVNPGWLLGMCVALHGRHPPAWLLTLPARRLDFGGEMSPEAWHAFPHALLLLAAHLGVRPGSGANR